MISNGMEISPEQKVKLYRGLKIALVVFLAVLVFSCRFAFFAFFCFFMTFPLSKFGKIIAHLPKIECVILFL